MAISFLRQTLAGLWILLALTIVTGVLYPAVVLLIGQTAFAGKANGTLVSVDGEVVGSALIGQSFDGDEYFLPRPSAAGDGYDALASSASNLAPRTPSCSRASRSDAPALHWPTARSPLTSRWMP